MKFAIYHSRIKVPTIIVCVSVRLASGASGLADSNRPTALLSVSTNLPALQKLDAGRSGTGVEKVAQDHPRAGHVAQHYVGICA